MNSYIYSIATSDDWLTSIFAHSQTLNASMNAQITAAWFCNKWHPELCTSHLAKDGTGRVFLGIRMSGQATDPPEGAISFPY